MEKIVLSNKEEFEVLGGTTSNSFKIECDEERSEEIKNLLTINNLNNAELQNAVSDVFYTFTNMKVLKTNYKNNILEVVLIDKDWQPEDIEENEEYVPTLEDIKNSKVNEMNNTQQEIIRNGINITLSDGTVEHFDLWENDQISLMGLQSLVATGQDMIPWHTSNNDEHCKFYSNQDMQIIITGALNFVSYNVTYFRDLRIYIKSLQSEDDVNNVQYGMNIPENYQSDVLKAMLLQNNQTKVDE